MADQGTYTATNLPADGETIEAADVNTDLQGLIDEFNKNIGTNKISDDAVTLAKIANEAWTTWTPTWTNVTIGNATVTGKYVQIGRAVFFNLVVVFGSTTSISGEVIFSLPVTAASVGGNANAFPLGNATLEDTGTLSYDGLCKLATTTTAIVKRRTVTGSNLANDTAISSTAPFTWTTNDVIYINGSYLAAT